MLAADGALLEFLLPLEAAAAAAEDDGALEEEEEEVEEEVLPLLLLLPISNSTKRGRWSDGICG